LLVELTNTTTTMNKSILTSAVASVVALYASSVSAATPATPYSNGDLLIDFVDAASPSKSYLVDAGSINQFLNATTPFTINLGASATNIGTDLNTLTGTSDWNTDGTLSFGGIARNATGTQIFITELTGNNDATNGTAGNANIVAGKVGTTGANYNNAQTTANNHEGIIQGNGGGTFISFNTFNSGIPAESYGYAYSLYGQDPNQAAPTAATVDLFQLNPANGAPNPAADLGTISLSEPTGTDAVLTFTPSVPEPTSAAMLALGAGFVGMIRRRKA
jgi:hypothetical protein